MSDTKKTTCKKCGGLLTFSPGDSLLKCKYCGFKQTIESSTEKIEELDFHHYLQELKTNITDYNETSFANCKGCGAEVTLKAEEHSILCPFCETQLSSETHKIKTIQPSSLIAFVIDEKEAYALFAKWLKGLWFAPNKLKKAMHHEARRLTGIYVPYWTYDSVTHSRYTGERGTDYYTTEKDSQGNEKKVRHTRWTKVSGQINKFFNDVLIIADKKLPEKQAYKLEPWDLTKLTDFKESYLTGFRTEFYQLDLEDGFKKAKEIIDNQIRHLIRKDIGGDHQRIHNQNTSYSNITFKHILLPIWLSSFRYGNKVYRFLVNGQSGEVQGERPYSIPKIITAVIVVFFIVLLIFHYT